MDLRGSKNRTAYLVHDRTENLNFGKSGGIAFANCIRGTMDRLIHRETCTGQLFLYLTVRKASISYGRTACTPRTGWSQRDMGGRSCTVQHVLYCTTRNIHIFLDRKGSGWRPGGRGRWLYGEAWTVHHFRYMPTGISSILLNRRAWPLHTRREVCAPIEKQVQYSLPCT